MKHIYREYDIRGIFGADLDRATVKKIGLHLGREIAKKGDTLAVGYDARTHSEQLFNWLISGLNLAGLKVLNLGLVPTPCCYFAGFSHSSVCATVMITGSHNPPEYNGFKITIDKLPFFGAQITALGEAIEADEGDIPDNFNCQKIDTLREYTEYLANHFAHLKNLDKKIVIDCGNGAAGVVVEPLIKALGLDAKVLFAKPDGTFPNHHPDPTVEKNLADIRRELSSGDYDIGFAFDGDADRIAVLTSANSFKGDELVIFYSKLLDNPQILGEVKCSQVMYDEINRRGRAYMYKTGHSNLKMRMRELKIDIAAEVSGHLFFNDRYFGSDDAIYAMLRTLELLQKGFDLDAEKAALPKMYSTDELKIATTESEKFATIDKLKEWLANPPASFPHIREIIDIDGVRVIFDDGWGLVRASNTTPVLVARFEAKSEELMRLYQEALTDALKRVAPSSPAALH
jgi:phosphomannomutase/phosphoglucomutase